MTIELVPAERGELLRQIERQMALTTDEARALRQARDAQEVVLVLIEARDDITVVWT